MAFLVSFRITFKILLLLQKNELIANKIINEYDCDTTPLLNIMNVFYLRTYTHVLFDYVDNDCQMINTKKIKIGATYGDKGILFSLF